MKEIEKMKSTLKYKDPVCGIWVAPEEAKAAVSYIGENYYFCSQNCAMEFNADPEKYLSHSYKEEGKLQQPDESMRMGHGMGMMKNKSGGHHGCCGRR